jgi:hypothetical protein
MASSTVEPRQFSLVIRYAGALADEANLKLSEYASSLTGWQHFFRLASDVLIRSEAEGPSVRPNDIIEIRVGIEREGSFETVIDFVIAIAAAEWIKKGAGTTYDAFVHRLKAWFKMLAGGHVSNKRRTTDITQLTAALESMAATNNVSLDIQTILEPTQELLDSTEEEEAEPVQTTKSRQITEKIDEHLRLATEPLDNSCTKIEILDEDRAPLISFGLVERAIITDPLTLPAPKRDWVESAVRFVRIHKQTGRAMFYFRDESETSHGAHYSRIIDPRIKAPGNPYTTAFNDNAYLEVWVRQRPPPKGRLQIQWDITVRAPDKQGLFPWQEPD